MSYDKGKISRYMFDTDDYGGGANITHYIRGPKGKTGQLWDYGVVDTTEAMAGGTTTPMAAVGVSGDIDKYGEEFDFGALAISESKSVRSTYKKASDIATYVLLKTIAADELIYLTSIASTGSGLTGMGKPFVDIIWAD